MRCRSQPSILSIPIHSTPRSKIEQLMRGAATKPTSHVKCSLRQKPPDDLREGGASRPWPCRPHTTPHTVSSSSRSSSNWVCWSVFTVTFILASVIEACLLARLYVSVCGICEEMMSPCHSTNVHVLTHTHTCMCRAMGAKFSSVNVRGGHFK